MNPRQQFFPEGPWSGISALEVSHSVALHTLNSLPTELNVATGPSADEEFIP